MKESREKRMPQGENREFQELIENTRKIKDSTDEFHVSFLDIGEKILKTLNNSFAQALSKPVAPAATSSTPKVEMAEKLNLSDIFSSDIGNATSFLHIKEFSNIQGKLLKNISSSVDNLELNFDKSLNISDILQKPEGIGGSIVSAQNALQFASVQSDLLDKIQTSVQSLEGVEFDTKLGISDILGKNEAADKMLFFQFASMKNDLIKAIKKGIPESINFEKTTISDIFGETEKESVIFRTQLAGIRQNMLNNIQEGAESLSFAAEDIQTPSTDTSLLKVTESGFDESHRLMNKMIEFLQPDSLADEEADRKKNAKYERLFGDTSTPVAQQDTRSSGFLSSFGDGMKNLGVGFGKMIEGILTGLGKGLRVLSDVKLFIGVGVLTALAGALALSALSFKQFADDIEWKNVFVGIGAISTLAAVTALLSKLSPSILLGSLAMTALAGALALSALSFKLFSELDWKNVFVGIGAVTALAGLAAVMGLVTPLLLSGSVALAALGASLIPLAGAMRLMAPTLYMFSEAMETAGTVIADMANAIGDSISSVVTSITSGIASIIGSVASVIDSVHNVISSFIQSIVDLSEVDGADLRDTASGVHAIGLALAGFGAGAGLGKLVSFFSTDPVAIFTRFASIGPDLLITTSAIIGLNEALSLFDASSITSDLQLLSAALLGLTVSRRSDPLQPLRELRDLLPSFSLSDTSGVDTLLDLIKHSSAAQLFTNTIDAMAHAFSMLVQSIDDLDIPKLESAMSLLSTEPVPMSVMPTRVQADDIDARQAENATLKDQAQYENMAMMANTVINNSTNAPSTTNVSRVTYNQSNHIDETMTNIVLSNRF